VRAGEALRPGEGAADRGDEVGAAGEPADPARHLPGGRGAREGRPGEDEAGGEREQLAGEAAHVLVGHRPEQEDEVRPAAQVRGEGARAGRVVGAVEEERRPSGHALEAAGPARRATRRGEAVEKDRDARGPRLLEQPHRHAQVVLLVRAGQGHERGVKRRPRRVHDPRADRARSLEDRDPGLLGQRADDRRPSRPQDARLLAGDRAERAAEVDLVVEVDAHDGRGDRLDDVRRVEPAPEADLEHGHVDPLPPEVLEGGGGQHLEERGVALEHAAAHEALGGVAHRADRGDEVARADLAAVDRDPLVEPDEVRRRVAPRPQARGPQRGVARGDDRALAVRARDEERGEGPLGVSHLGDEGAHRLEAELHAEPRALGEVAGDTVGRQRRHE
jgi:hypothetical protein